MKRSSKFVLVIASLASVAGFSSVASAETPWGYHHPRQHEVLARTHHQIARINQKERAGEISPAKARHMRQADYRIAARDRADARANGGYITKAEQHHLNQRLNRHSNRIGGA